VSITPISGFNLFKLVDAGLAAETANEWHEPDGYWHASSLTMCPRRLVLWQAGLATDGVPRSGAMNFALGHDIHAHIERWAPHYAAVEPRFELVGVELSGQLDDLRLKARCDILARWEGELILFEIKSERSGCTFCKRGGATHFRIKEAADEGFPTAVKKEHWVQGTAQAMCLEAKYGPIKQARAIYWQKNDFLLDTVPFSTDDTQIRQWIADRCHQLTDLHYQFKNQGALPQRITPGTRDDWQCRPRGPRDSDDPQAGQMDERGLYCPARAVCMRSNA
jgi:hypothetical protein